MIGYDVEGPVVVITTDGAYSKDERDALYDAIRNDAVVRNGALILIDARRNVLAADTPELREGVTSLVTRLGPKLGRACALVRAPDRRDQALRFQLIASTYDVRVGVFTDVAAARAWLEAYAEV